MKLCKHCAKAKTPRCVPCILKVLGREIRIEKLKAAKKRPFSLIPGTRSRLSFAS